VTSATSESEAFLAGIEGWIERQENPDTLRAWDDVLAALERRNASDSWKELIENLKYLGQVGFRRGFTPTVVKTWAQRVARYSFSVQPVRVQPRASA
jgi:hypothetical protein